jgi:hypothetical protein
MKAAKAAVLVRGRAPTRSNRQNEKRRAKKIESLPQNTLS